MKIYAAGYYLLAKNYLTNPEKANDSLRPLLGFTPEHCLESYHYIGEAPGLCQWMRDNGKKLFLDSGAFSAFTKGAVIDLQRYSDFIKQWSDIIDVASNVDIIGRDNEQGSYDNQKRLELLGVDIKPVHHARDRDEWLTRYLSEGYDHLFLGGMVPETTPYLLEWLDRIWARYLTNPDGTPKIKVHGFGLTTEVLMYRYPWYSVDSTTWLNGNKFGVCFMDMPLEDGTTFRKKITFSKESPLQLKYDAHYDTFAPEIQKRISDYVEEKGYTIEQLRTQYGSRSRWNLEYYTRSEHRVVTKFVPEQPLLF